LVEDWESISNNTVVSLISSGTYVKTTLQLCIIKVIKSLNHKGFHSNKCIDRTLEMMSDAPPNVEQYVPSNILCVHSQQYAKQPA